MSSTAPTDPTPTTTAPNPTPAPAPTTTTDLTPVTTAAGVEHGGPPPPQPGAVPQPPTATATAPAPTPAAQQPVEERQTPLTKQFTEAEWTALRELRTHLPDVLIQAYDESKRESTVLWGVPIDPKNPTNPKTSVVLMKFLRAKNLNVSSAKSMLIETLRWREQFDIPAAMKAEYPPDIFSKLGHVYGRDKEGRPVTYNLYGANKDVTAVFGDIQRFLRWRVALMENSLKMMDWETVDQTVQVHDYAGVSMWTGRDANAKNAASEASSIFNSHYPELLHKKFFVNAPSLMNWIFWLFKPILPAKTMAKMTVVGHGSHDIAEALLAVIAEDQLPKRYGGKADPGW